MEHALFFPKHCGLLYRDEKDETIILKLTEKLLPEEERSQFAKYYYLGACPPSAETLKTLEPGQDLPIEAAFMPEEYAQKMLGKSSMELQNGICVMKNGVGYVALQTFQEGVNDENMQYFNDHFVPEQKDLFYKIWCPGEHIRLYPDLAIENMGWGWGEVRITDFFGKEEFNLPGDLKDLDPAIIDFQAMNIEVVPLGAPAGTEPLRLVEANCFRQLPEGREIRHRFWIGCRFENGKGVPYPVGDFEKTAYYARKTAYHSGSEFATLTRNVIQFYIDRH